MLLLKRLKVTACLITVFAIFSLFIHSTTEIGETAKVPPSTTNGAPTNMTLTQAMVLGIVEGVTEYLPISSTGHLLLTERAMGIGEASSGSPQESRKTKDAANAYTICIQAGAILAVLGLYMKRVKQMVLGAMGKDSTGLRMITNIAVGFMPAAVLGLTAGHFIKEHLFGLWPVVTAWLAGGLAILGASWWQKTQGTSSNERKSLDELTWRMALAIGIAQCIAMWPGVSRSLVTIVGGIMAGLSLTASVEFSFLLGVVTLGAATSYDAIKHGQAMLQTFGLSALFVGFIFAFVFAVLSIRWMVRYLERHGLAIFGYYRIGLALAVGGLLVLEMI